MRHYQRGIATSLILIVLLLVGVAIASGAFIFFQKQQKLKSINSFEDCAKLYPVLESYPAQCNTPDGRHFVQDLSEEEKQKLVPPIKSSPLVIADETANWKTYKNTKVGFEIKYPASFNNATVPGGLTAPEANGAEDETSILFNSDADQADYQLTVFPFSGTINDLVTERQTVAAALPTNKIPIIFPDKPTDLTQKTQINGEVVEWFATSRKRTDGGFGVEIYFLHKNHGYIVRAGEFYPVDKILLNQVLSTLKFL